MKKCWLWKLYLLFLSYFFSRQLIYVLYSYSLNMQTIQTSSIYDKKWNFHFARIILNAFNVSLSTQILILAIVPLLFISVSIFCEFAMLPDVYILLSPQEEKVHFSWGNRCTHLAADPSKILSPLSVIILACLGNIKKTRLQDKLLRHWSS